MNEPTIETLARRLSRVEPESRRSKRAGPLGLAVIAAVMLMGQAKSARVAKAQAADLATVKSAALPVHSEMDSTSPVVNTLMRGDLVEIDLVFTPPEDVWCSVTEIGGKRTSGFVRCVALERRKTTPSEPVRLIEKPTPKPIAKVTEPEVKREKRYTLQIATLVVEENVLALKKRLEGLGYTPAVRKATVPIRHHRVYTGEFGRREEAEQTVRRLDIDDFQSKVVETEGGQIRLEVGSYFDLNKAIDLAHRLQKKNYTTKIVSEARSTPVHVVRVGEYPTREEALKALETLKRRGFASILVRQ